MALDAVRVKILEIQVFNERALEPLIEQTLEIARRVPRLLDTPGVPLGLEAVGDIRILEQKLAWASLALDRLAKSVEQNGVNVRGSETIARVAFDYCRMPLHRKADLDTAPELELPADLRPEPDY